MKLTEVKYIKDTYFHRFQLNDSSFIDIETSKEDYEQLGKANPKNPEIKYGRWVGSIGGVPVFDTSDGKLHDGEWASIRGEFKMIKLEGKPEKSVTNEEIL